MAALFTIAKIWKQAKCSLRDEWGGGFGRWQKSKTRRSPSSPQIHQKYIYTWNCSYSTPTER